MNEASTRLEHASLLLDRPAPPHASADGALRAVAVLLRQGLEAALAEHWMARGMPTVAEASMRHQLIALSVTWPGNPEVAAEVESAWYRLTRACHGDTGRPMLTAGELRSVGVVIQALSAPTRGIPINRRISPPAAETMLMKAE
jgi:hypothetical protein